MKLALVTGAAGWLGRRLVEVLVAGLPGDERFREPDPDLRIRALILPGEDGEALSKLSPRVEVMTGDIRNPDDSLRFMTGTSGATLFHAAGVIHPRGVHEFYTINVEGTKNVLDAAAHKGVRRAVVVSSNSPCGCNPTREHRFDETSPFNPYMHYGRSKKQMEQLLPAYLDRLETVCIRPPWFYGPYGPPRQALFFRMIRDGRAPILGDGGNMRSMCYIDNLCQGLLLAAQTSEAAGKTYWIADERPYTMNEIINTIERLLESEFGIACCHKRLRLPHVASQVAQAVDFMLQRLGLYHQKIHVLGEMNKNIACDIAKARAELGYRPHVGLEEGMRRSIAWARASL